MSVKRCGPWFVALLVAAAATIAVPATAAARPSAAADPSDGGAYHAVTPTRLLDTRHGIGVNQAGKVGAGKNLVLNVFSPPHVASDPVPRTATAVALNITVVDVSVGGHLTAYPGQASRPRTSTINFYAGRNTANLALLRIGPDGTVNLTNASGGPVDLLADVSGYFQGSVSADGQGTFHALPEPVRRLETTRPVAAGSRTIVSVTSEGVPSDASSVAVNVAAVDPSSAGHLTAYPTGGSPGGTSTLNFEARHNIANLADVAVGNSGAITLINQSKARTGLLVDVSGYFTGGDPTGMGGFGALSPTRVLDTRGQRALGPDGTVTFSVSGRAGVPITTGAGAGTVQAVVLNVAAVSPTTGGHLTVWGGGETRPGVSNVNFSAHQNVANAVIAPVSRSGTVEIGNGATGTVDVLADVTGYVLGASSTVPAVSVSRYVRNISGVAGTGSGSDYATMQSEGQADCAGGSKLVLLDIGAQSNATPSPSPNGVVLSSSDPGVVLSATPTRLHYDQLVTALDGYLDGFAGCSGTIAVGTNTDGDWTIYSAESRARDWATQVIAALQAHATSGEDVVGANDIEASFDSSDNPGPLTQATAAQARTWVSAYLADAGAGSTFINNGDAESCPTDYGSNADCGAVKNQHGPTWTREDYRQLSYAIAPGRIEILPQTYLPSQARQWANLDRYAAGRFVFAGALTEHATDSSGFTPDQGWAALHHTISTVVTSPSIPQLTDLRPDTSAGAGAAARRPGSGTLGDDS